MKCLVTGGGGFLGSAIVKQLISRQDDVKTIQRNDYPFLREWGVETVRGDLSQFETINNAVKDCETVFHVAAKAGVWGAYDEYHQANVIATENVIKACKENGVRKLVYTSTPSVVFDGHDEDGVDESTPYTEYFFNAYQNTKAEAEQKVLQANGEELKTVALRPHLIWGPGDTNLVPRVINRAKSGKLKLVDARTKKIDACYIDNAAHAHILAANCLESNSKCAGKVYFISNGEPMAISNLINGILKAAGLPENKNTVSANTAYIAGTVLETIYKLFNIKSEPIMTRFVAKQLSTSHWFKLDAAKNDLGYVPAVSTEEGLKRLQESLAKES